MTKQTMRKLAALLLAGLFLFLMACEEYTPPVRPSGPNGAESTETEIETVTGADGEVDENPFTVSLTYEGKPYIPSSDDGMKVQWNDGYSLHEASFGEDGVARIGGLDGDYRVTLTAVPAGYTYNPNIYTATNGSRQVEIRLHKLLEPVGVGDQKYNSIRIQSTGVYCVDIKNAEQEVFYEFAPTESGTYSVESWMDITADDINPYANYYGANIAFKEFRFTQDDGGAASYYTKNFKLNVEIADENMSQGGGGATAFTFGIKASSKSETFPTKIYFAVTLNGEFSLNHAEAQMMVPQEPLKSQKDYDASEYDFVGAEFSVTNESGNTANVFDGDRYRYWPESEGGDNYYHLYNEEEYPETGGYGPILYAKISSPTRFMQEPFTMLEYLGNKALTLENGTENYKLFIEGYAYLNSYTLSATNPNGKPPYFCTLDCPCRLNGTNDSIAITGEVGCCIEGCEECDPDCNNLPEEAIGHEGYGNYTNSDGCYGVTQELKEFLQKYSVSQLLFFDGNGFVETHPTVSVYAEEDDQWLFGCGYYVKKTS